MDAKLRNSVLGGTDNNMPPLKTITGGIDWLELSVFVDMAGVWEKWVGEVFENALNAAKEENEEQVVHVFDHQMAVQSFGSHFGPMYYDFRAFDQKDLVWWFRKEPVDHANIASVRVRVSGEACLCANGGVEGLIHWIYLFFVKLQCSVRKISVSRCDFCIDLPNVSIESLRSAHFRKDFVTRSKSHSVVEDGGTVDKDTWRYLQSKGLTLYYGRSPLTLRCYDKLAELDHKMNPRKWQAMVLRRWGGEEPVHATRVEFELRREALKQRGIDTIEDLFHKRTAIVEYLTGEWFRYVKKPRGQKEKRKCRWPVHPVWKTVQGGFSSVFGGSMDRDLSPLPKAECDVSALGKQAFGVVMKAAECQGEELGSYQDFMRYCSKFFQSAAKAKKREEWFETHGGKP